MTGGAGLSGAPDGLAGLLSAVPSRPRPAFALTPLADVMFQLLIFFMLSSSLAPYALLPIDRPDPAPTADVAPQSADSAAPPPAGIVWQLGRGEVRTGGTRLPLDDLPAEIAALRRAAGPGETPEIVILTTAAARTGDLARVLELVSRAGPLRARILGQEMPPPAATAGQGGD